MTDEQQDQERIPDKALELMVSLMEYSHDQTTHVTNQLLESYKEERDLARAQLWAIRNELDELFSQGVMPTPSRIMRIVHEPDDRMVQLSLANMREYENR